MHQFFSNTTGLLAPESEKAFRAIGLMEWATLLSEAMRFFGTTYPRDREERQELLASVPGARREEWDPFSALDKQFFESTDDWQDAADAYADRYRHAQEQ